MHVKRLRLSAIDDPAFVTAIQAAAAEVDCAPELEQLLRSRGWQVEVVELAEPASVDQPALDVRRHDAAVTSDA